MHSTRLDNTCHRPGRHSSALAAACLALLVGSFAHGQSAAKDTTSLAAARAVDSAHSAAGSAQWQPALLGTATHTVPSISADDAPDRSTYGFGRNLEQPLADSGETGLFATLGWNDGSTESFVFTEVDRHASLGLQLGGTHWHRLSDHIGIAGVLHGIVAVPQQYLAAGGDGFLLGDGALNYGREQIVEGYYRSPLGDVVEVTPDIQDIRNPGYNRDRGPVTVPGIRLNLRY